MTEINDLKSFPLSKRQIIIFANIFFWVSFIAFDSISTTGALNGYYEYTFTRSVLHSIICAFLVYPHLYWLYPTYFSNRLYVQYTFGALLLLGINVFIRVNVDQFFSTHENVATYMPWAYDKLMSDQAIETFVNGGFMDMDGNFNFSYYLGMTVGSLGVFFITTPIKLVEDWYEKQILRIQLLKNKTETQQAQLKLQEAKLNFLKAQTDPHFLINALSGVYNLALLQSDKIDYALLRLSELMGYLLGKGKLDLIDLQQEVDFIENYISFSKAIHLEDLKIEFSHNLSPSDLTNLEIPPMLLQPFLENALKHGDATDNSEGWIKSKLNYEASILTFEIENSVNPSKINRKIKSYGVGIPNLKERLEMYFSNRSQLEIEQKEASYKATLTLNLENQ